MELDDFQISGKPAVSDELDYKCFTRKEANDALPLVRRIMQDVVDQYRIAMELHMELQKQEVAEKDVEKVDAARRSAVSRLNDLAAELSDIGCELKDWETGWVDFPAMLDGREVCLCWKLDEEEVNFWHETHEGFSGRIPISKTDQFETNHV